MVYIRLNDTLSKEVDIQKLITISIDNSTYLSYSSLRQTYPKLQLQKYIKHDQILSELTIKELQMPPPPPEHVQLMKQLKLKRQRRLYQKLLDPKKAGRTYFEVTPDQGIREMQKSISFGLTFIFSFFLAGVTGYLLGIYIFEVSHTNSMIIAIFFVIVTLIVEVLLFIIRSHRMDALKARKQKMSQQKHYRSKPMTNIPPSISKIDTQQKKKQ